jgi:hypothetical protein
MGPSTLGTPHSVLRLKGRGRSSRCRGGRVNQVQGWREWGRAPPILMPVTCD